MNVINEARQTFHQQLDEVRADVARLAAMVTDIIPRGTQVLLDGDMEGAKQLIEHDDELDRLTLHIEEQCYQLLVLQQPMAGDLRVIVSALRMASEIERSGDLVANIAKTMRRIYGDELTPRIRGLVEQMSEEAARLYKAAIDAYLDEDDALAAAIDDMDDVLDGLQKDFIEAVIEAHEADRIDLNAAVQLALIARYYERIGDHAVNMGERVQYLVTGWLPEHGTAAVADARERHRPGPVEIALAERKDEA
jgi:phosphate transport system protein